MLSVNSFKSEYTFNSRHSEAAKVLYKYPTRAPIVCERAKYAGIDCPYIDKKKYLVPLDLTLAQFIFVIRKRLKMCSEQSLFIFINNTIPASNRTIGDIYKFYKDTDGFLYMTYSYENVFG